MARFSSGRMRSSDVAPNRRDKVMEKYVNRTSARKAFNLQVKPSAHEISIPSLRARHAVHTNTRRRMKRAAVCQHGTLTFCCCFFLLSTLLHFRLSPLSASQKEKERLERMIPKRRKRGKREM